MTPSKMGFWLDLTRTETAGDAQTPTNKNPVEDGEQSVTKAADDTPVLKSSADDGKLYQSADAAVEDSQEAYAFFLQIYRSNHYTPIACLPEAGYTKVKRHILIW